VHKSSQQFIEDKVYLQVLGATGGTRLVLISSTILGPIKRKYGPTLSIKEEPHTFRLYENLENFSLNFFVRGGVGAKRSNV